MTTTIIKLQKTNQNKPIILLYPGRIDSRNFMDTYTIPRHNT